ncbi:ankyrin repeat domain-containing protein [Pedobacter sp. PLR]|uniref:ankyrin repeat domain-containing protein n=1 Tax=Pedobacter sp. PLR TaxID=2994465 RepID=UPI0022462994|nr:ankyrin repeat domain-containing protein [Pedobacter sp. PLR]MCX2452555.1 ankyrin repeat domain-containing protein [Pedobacter sp. PLR]
MINNPTTTAINNGDFVEAQKLVANGDNFPVGIDAYALGSIYQKIITAKAFSFLDTLIEAGKLETDIYEYDSFKTSIFKTLFKSLPADEDSLSYLESFVQKHDNINDEVGGETLLSFALAEGAAPAIIKALIAGGCNTDFRNAAEENLIYQVVNNNQIKPELISEYLSDLLDNGLDLNEANIEGTTALHLAVKRAKREVIPVLLANGANPNEVDGKGITAFYTAAVDLSDLKIYEALSENHQPDFEQRSREKETMLSAYLRMMQSSESAIKLLEKLIDEGADLKQVSPYYSKDKSGLDWLAEKKSPVFSTIVKKGIIELNDQDDEGNTLLHKVCAVDSNYDQEVAKDTYRKVKLLLESGADVSITNSHDETAMMIASGDNLKTKTVEILLSAKS